ncbi:MAG: hypothetical protein V1723_02505 [Candidatus Uhrbacteria bacterium]
MGWFGKAVVFGLGVGVGGLISDDTRRKVGAAAKAVGDDIKKRVVAEAKRVGRFVEEEVIGPKEGPRDPPPPAPPPGGATA